MLERLLRLLWRVLRGAFLALAAAVLYLEEWGWRPLTAWMARLARWPPLQRLEDRLRSVPPRWALALFLLPAVALFPIKLLALWLIHLGRTGLGIGVIVAAKLLGTALLGRLFMLVEPQLMQFAWFARALGWWRATKEKVKAAVHARALMRTLRASKRRWAAWLRRFARGQ